MHSKFGRDKARNETGFALDDAHDDIFCPESIDRGGTGCKVAGDVLSACDQIEVRALSLQ
jgi:hypothetical protein